MSTEVATQQVNAVASPRDFRDHVTRIATFVLSEWVGEERARESVGRVTVALTAAMSSAKDPRDFYACTPNSVAHVIAISALSGIMPSTGAGALAWVLPRRDRKEEAPKLRYQLSHRGVNALAARAGMVMIPIPVNRTDKITLSPLGDVDLTGIDIENPPTSESEFRGICLVVKDIRSGSVVTCQFVPKKVIDERRNASDSYQFAKKNQWAQKSDPWHKWYVEMAMKTAMHYAIGRGWCVIDDSAAQRALTLDQENDLTPIESDESKSSRLDQLASMLGHADPAPEHEEDKSDVIDVDHEPARNEPSVSQETESRASSDEAPFEDSAEETTAESPKETVSRFAPKYGEETKAYHLRVSGEIKSATAGSELDEIQTEIDAALSSGFLNGIRHKSLSSEIAKRVAEISAS